MELGAEADNEYEENNNDNGNESIDNMAKSWFDDQSIKKIQHFDEMENAKLKYIQIPKSTQIEAFNSLSHQRYSLSFSQCDDCRANRVHPIIEEYGQNFAVILNLCQEDLDYNKSVSNMFWLYWPKKLDAYGGGGAGGLKNRKGISFLT